MRQKWPKVKYLLVLGLCLVLMVIMNIYLVPRDSLSGQVFAASKKLLEIADNRDCAACHGGERVLPDGHDETKGMTDKTCKTCHNHKEQNLQGKVPLSHLHLWNGVSCRGCHGEVVSQKALTTDKCFSCHKSYQEVARLTKDLSTNPHESHFGNIECSQCHKAHNKSTLYCNKCHDFDFKVP
jgi:hypothetical protein